MSVKTIKLMTTTWPFASLLFLSFVEYNIDSIHKIVYFSLEQNHWLQTWSKRTFHHFSETCVTFSIDDCLWSIMLIIQMLVVYTHTHTKVVQDMKMGFYFSKKKWFSKLHIDDVRPWHMHGGDLLNSVLNGIAKRSIDK